MNSFIRRFVGDKEFYKRVFAIVIPITIQSGITNFVNLLDNLMVGQVGTVPMSGVAIINQLIFVFNLCIFGGLSGAGIFGSQYWGKRNHEGLRNVFRMKVLIALFVSLVGILVFLIFDDNLIMWYLKGEGNSAEINALTLQYAKEYLSVSIWGLLPFALIQIYVSSLRETEETVLPMKAGIAAVVVNLVFNYLLIFGNFGFPELGVKGAAIATVLSRFVELAIVLIWTYMHTSKFPYFIGAFRHFRIPTELFTGILKKGTPLLANEALWSMGIAAQLQCYSLRGLEVVAAMNISNTINNLFNIAFISMGNAVAIIIGMRLGANEIEEAKDEDRKLIALSIVLAASVAIIEIALSSLFPLLYKTEPEVRAYASQFIIISASFMPMAAFLHASYFTIRSGGKTIVTFLFDSAFMWVVTIPLAKVLANYTSMPIQPLYICVLAADVIKCIVGFVMLKKGVWIQNIVDKKEEVK
ncbi:MAG: MATE family efflux transporter [Lachnospiraceae bacterium]|nr:MATE family efflux transporter [Lachnospiraceae bacterium]